MKKLLTLLSVLVLASLMLVACGGKDTNDAATEAAAATEAPAAGGDMLADIMERGYILVSTDPNYEPQSFLNTEGSRPADTKCPSDALSTEEMQGFDVDVAKAVGDDLGVETCFATPSWDAITAGNWADKWDVSIGSMTINVARQEILDFSVPYYYTPAVVAVAEDSGFTKLEDLSGQTLCAGAATTYESWLNNDMEGLGLPETSIYAKVPADVTVSTLETDQECAQAIASGRKDFVGYVTSETVVDANIAADMPVVKIEGAVYSEDLAAAFDKSASLDTTSLREKVDALFTKMHSDGTLTELSTQWFEIDLTQAPK